VEKELRTQHGLRRDKASDDPDKKALEYRQQARLARAGPGGRASDGDSSPGSQRR